MASTPGRCPDDFAAARRSPEAECTSDAPVPDATPHGSRRRRLWELPAAAQELLLGLALPAPLLRATVQQALGRQRGAKCQLGGTDVDLLYATLHDLAARNEISEALHKLLDSRYATVVQRMARLDADELLAAWHAAWHKAPFAPSSSGIVAGDGAQADLPAQLWALLTHRSGATLQDAALRDARAWLFQQARAKGVGAAQSAAMRAEQDRLKGELAQAREAIQQGRSAAARQAEADALIIATLRGELARARAAAALAAAQGAPRGTHLESAANRPQAKPPPAQPPATSVSAPTASNRPGLRAPAATAPEGMSTSASVQAASALPIQIVAGRNVLCVGGLNGAIHRYRAMVEARGGRFLHHDGGIEDSMQRLHAHLAAADLVLCQAGCVNHEAYRCVKTHCKRAGTACVYLDRPSLSRFARELEARGPAP